MSSSLLELLSAPRGPQVAIEDRFGARDWSYIRLHAARGRQRLAELAPAVGNAPGPRIGLLVEPGAAWLSSLLAILEAGAIAVPLSPRYPDRELSFLLQDCEASLLVVSDSLRRPNLDVTQISTVALCCATPTAAAPAQPPQDEHIALLLYTSGTTGRPKGAQLTHAGLGRQLLALIDRWRLRQRRALLHALPLHHMHGIGISLLPCLAAGMRCRMLERFCAETVWDELAAVDTFMAVPTMYHRLLDAFEAADRDRQARWRQSARALSLATSGSAALPASLAGRWQQVAGSIPLERWGMTEIGVGCSGPLEPDQRRRGWVGTPLAGVELVLIDDDGQRHARQGEIWVRGSGLFSGYWRRPEETARALEAGWFRTGDVAERDEDGWVRIVGRSSTDIFKSGGYKLSALEIEEHLRDHPAVEQVAVVGLQDPLWGQRVVAAVVPRPGRAEACSAEALAAFARDRLAPYKLPRAFVLLDALPRNAVGKVLKGALASLLADRGA